jgi:hypothetical protein
MGREMKAGNWKLALALRLETLRRQQLRDKEKETRETRQRPAPSVPNADDEQAEAVERPRRSKLH